MSKVICTQCGVVGDLLPLYIDECCSDESRIIVENHLEECAECRAIYENMSCASVDAKQEIDIPKGLSRINHWKASVLQSVLLFVSFGILAVAITMEAYTPYGINNGLWAFAAIVPTTGFMLSLSNWYFIRVYKSRRFYFSSLWEASTTPSTSISLSHFCFFMKRRYSIFPLVPFIGEYDSC